MQNNQASPGWISAAGSQPAPTSDFFELDLERYWIEARTLKFWLAGLVALGLLAGIIVTLLSTELYRASTRPRAH